MENWLRGRPKFHGFDMNGFPPGFLEGGDYKWRVIVPKCGGRTACPSPF